MLVRSLWVHSTHPVSKKQEFSEKELLKPLRGAALKIQTAMYLRMVQNPIATIPHSHLANYAGVTLRHVRRTIALLKARGSIVQLPSVGKATYRHRPYCRYTYPPDSQMAIFLRDTTQYGDLKQMHQTWLSELLLKNVLYINDVTCNIYLNKRTICNSRVLERIPRARAQGERTTAPSRLEHCGTDMLSAEERFAILRKELARKRETAQACLPDPASRSLTAGNDRPSGAQQGITALKRGQLQMEHVEELVRRYVMIFGEKGVENYKNKLLSELGLS